MRITNSGRRIGSRCSSAITCPESQRWLLLRVYSTKDDLLQDGLQRTCLLDHAHCNCTDSIVFLITWGQKGTLILFIDIYAVEIGIAAIVGTHVTFLAALGSTEAVNRSSVR